MSESNEISWRDLYRAAVLESNSSLLQVRVNEALSAINARASDGHWVPRDERIDMDEARFALRGLKSRGWQSKVRAAHVESERIAQEPSHGQLNSSSLGVRKCLK
jgi:hypothetical protein